MQIIHLLIVQALVLLVLILPQPGLTQGMMENGGLNSMMGGMGAGLAASLNHGAVVRRSFEAVGHAQEAAILQTKAIGQYMQVGCKFEAAKQWDYAEKSFKYVLKVVALRDGPGSRASVPALQHLVTVTQAENKLDEAIDFQKTVLAFTKSAKVADYGAMAQQEENLSNLYIQKDDYVNAEPVLRAAVTVYDSCPSLPDEKRSITKAAYAKVLRKIKKKTDPQSADEAIEQAANLPEGKDSTLSSKGVDKLEPSAAETASPGKIESNKIDIQAGKIIDGVITPTEAGLPPLFPNNLETDKPAITESH